jgi:hypothetical protein
VIARRRRLPSWWATRKERLGGWLARSQHVFLVGVIVACSVEVFVDWNSTLFEINVLRDGLRQRGASYAGVLVKASEAPLRDRDRAALAHLSVGLFDDDDVAYVRFSDPRGEVLYEALRPGLDEQFASHHGKGLVSFYRHQIERDSEQILADPKGMAEQMRRSPYRDIVQRWSDAVAALTARLSKPAPPVTPHHVVLYQDRLSDESRRHDREMTYAIGAVVDAHGDKQGVVLVAFSMARTNDATTKKYLKGGLMIAFFVALILVQNVIARRDKLRLLDLEERHRAAKEALQQAMPAGEPPRGWQVGGAIDQAEGPVDGCLWSLEAPPDFLELLVIEPDGEGIDAAATALQIGRAHRRRHEQPGAASQAPAVAGGPPEGLRAGVIAEEIAALGQAVAGIPLTRPIAIMLLRVAQSSGQIAAMASQVGEVFVLGEGAPRRLTASREEPAPPGVVGPLRHLEGTLGPGEIVALIAAGGGPALAGRSGAGRGAERIDSEAVAAFVASERARHPDLAELAHAATEWARARSPALAGCDLVVVLASRAGLPGPQNR